MPEVKGEILNDSVGRKHRTSGQLERYIHMRAGDQYQRMAEHFLCQAHGRVSTTKACLVQ